MTLWFDRLHKDSYWLNQPIFKLERFNNVLLAAIVSYSKHMKCILALVNYHTSLNPVNVDFSCCVWDVNQMKKMISHPSSFSFFFKLIQFAGRPGKKLMLEVNCNLFQILLEFCNKWESQQNLMHMRWTLMIAFGIMHILETHDCEIIAYDYSL